MLKQTWVFFFLFTLNAVAATDLGRELTAKTKSDGTPSFGVRYAYGDDRDGSMYLFTFAPKVSANGIKSLRWNFYLRSTDTFLFDWSDKHTIDLAVMQVKLDDSVTPAIEKIIQGHKAEKEGEAYFILADKGNRPQFHISISGLCQKYPDHFTDLTYGRRCDEPKL